MDGDVAMWIFGHGSLMFEPRFRHEARTWGRSAHLERRFGHPSVRNWGTRDAPAPTCCLVPGGGVDGVLFGVASADAAATLDALRRREACDPDQIEVDTATGSVTAHAWPMRNDWSELDGARLAARARRNVAAGGGPAGTAVDYLTGVARILATGPGLDQATDAYLTALGLARPQDSEGPTLP